MTRDESLEAALLVQAVALVVASLLLARLGHAALAHALPSLKPPVATGEYVHLLVIFLPIWVFALLYVAVGLYALSLWWLVPVRLARPLRHPR